MFPTEMLLRIAQTMVEKDEDEEVMGITSEMMPK